MGSSGVFDLPGCVPHRLFVPSAHLVLHLCLLERLAAFSLLWILVKRWLPSCSNNPRQSWLFSLPSCNDPVRSASLAARSWLFWPAKCNGSQPHARKHPLSHNVKAMPLLWYNCTVPCCGSVAPWLRGSVDPWIRGSVAPAGLHHNLFNEVMRCWARLVGLN